MGKNKMEEKTMELDLSNDLGEMIPITKQPSRVKEEVIEYNTSNVVSCLRNEVITVRKVSTPSNLNLPANHICSKGMVDGARRIFTVPRLSSGLFVNVLTDAEKDYLEMVMGFEKNALSIYKKKDNFWDDSNDNGINKVILFKEDNYLDLRNPEDYIRYKILLANKHRICPSQADYDKAPLRSYEFIILAEKEEAKRDSIRIETKQQCYMEFGKMDDNRYKMAMVVELFEGHPVNPKSEISWLKARIDAGINSNASKMFSIMKDEYLDTKILIKRSLDAGTIYQKGLYFYLQQTNEPMCEEREEPTFDNAAKYLNSPKRQQVKFALEEAIKNID